MHPQERTVGEAWDLLVAPYAEGLGITVAAALTLMVYSYLLGDNVLYRIAEHIFVGVAVGYSAVVAFHSVLYPKLLAPLLAAPQENLLLLVPLALCLMLLAHAIPAPARAVIDSPGPGHRRGGGPLRGRRHHRDHRSAGPGDPAAS